MIQDMDFLPYQPLSSDRDDSPEKEEKKEKEPKYKLEEKFLETRTILLFGEITQKVAREVCEKLILLSALNDNDIKVIINSQGGHVEAGDTIHDMLTFVKPKVKVLGTGWVASAGALIYVAVPTEHRYSLPNTRFMLHQPSGGVGGQASDISIEAQEILKMRDRLNNIFSVQTGQPVERVEKDTDRNFWMSAEEAKVYGLVGKVITSQADF
jgi:ATP-dependent Clp protease, protease subunit